MTNLMYPTNEYGFKKEEEATLFQAEILKSCLAPGCLHRLSTNDKLGLHNNTTCLFFLDSSSVLEMSRNAIIGRLGRGP